MLKNNVLSMIMHERAILIFRDIPKEKLIASLEACRKGGIRLAEITFDPTGTVSDREIAESIRKASEYFGDELIIGAGTVLNRSQAEMATSAGAYFLISPNTDKKVIECTVNSGLVSIPGALTPSEITTAYDYGADLVKVFPAETFGPSYIRAIRSPLPHIPLVATGGVNENNAADYIRSGVNAVAIGGCIVKKDAIMAGNYAELEASCRRLCDSLYVFKQMDDEAEENA